MARPEDSLLRGYEPSRTQEELSDYVRRFYDRHGRDYDDYHWYSRDVWQQRRWREEAAWICRNVEGRPPRVLDVGSGTGNLALKFLDTGAEVVGVDLSFHMATILKRKAGPTRAERLRLVVADVARFAETTRGTFDVICECSVLHHIMDYERLLDSLIPRLRPGGMLFLTRELLSPAEIGELGRFRSAINDRLERLYRRIFQWLQARGHLAFKVTAPDQSRGSIHFYENGVSLERVRALARAHGLRERRFRKFNARETGIISWLDNVLFRPFRRERFQKTFYSVIFERPREILSHRDTADTERRTTESERSRSCPDPGQNS